MANKLGVIQVIGNMEFDENNIISEFSKTEIGKQLLTAIESNKPVYFDIIISIGGGGKIPIKGFGTIVDTNTISFGGFVPDEFGKQYLLNLDDEDNCYVYVYEI